nr:hypothetical protein [Tanacetum cinerariifolium]
VTCLRGWKCSADIKVKDSVLDATLCLFFLSPSRVRTILSLSPSLVNTVVLTWLLCRVDLDSSCLSLEKTFRLRERWKAEFFLTSASFVANFHSGISRSREVCLLARTQEGHQLLAYSLFLPCSKRWNWLAFGRAGVAVDCMGHEEVVRDRRCVVILTDMVQRWPRDTNSMCYVWIWVGIILAPLPALTDH